METTENVVTTQNEPQTNVAALENEVDNDEHSLLNPEGGETEPPPEEEDEIEVDGRKFALPKTAAEKLRSERMMHADYTQKTMSVANDRKMVEEYAQNVAQQYQQQQAILSENAKILSIDAQIEQFQKLDWNTIISQDPQYAMQLQQQQRALEGKRQEAINGLTQKQQQQALNEQQVTAKLMQDANSYWMREIPGWSDARSTQLLNYGVSQGIPAHVLGRAAINQPALAKILHKAELYDAILKKQTPPAAAPVIAKPAVKVGSNAKVSKDPTKMSDAEFAAYRRGFGKSKK